MVEINRTNLNIKEHQQGLLLMFSMDYYTAYAKILLFSASFGVSLVSRRQGNTRNPLILLGLFVQRLHRREEQYVTDGRAVSK